MVVPEPNHLLRAARERTPSRIAPGDCMSRRELAEAVAAWLWDTTNTRYDLDTRLLSKWERGHVRWPSAPYRAALRAVLRVTTDAALGFWPCQTGSTSALIRRASQSAAVPDYSHTVDLGGSPTEFLARMTVESPTPARIGWTDVDQVRATTRALAASENLFGGGLSCEAAVGQLRWAGRLLEARAKGDVHRAMCEAVGNLAAVVAFSAFDIGNQVAARQYFRFALWCADEGNSWPLRAATLADLARQAVYLGDTDEALSLIEFAQVRADRLSATGRAMVWTVHARLLALLGRHDEACAEVERADSYFADRAPDEDPPWLAYYDRAEHQGSTARALVPAAMANRNPGQAAERLTVAIQLHSNEYPRSRAFSRTRLAALTMAAGDPYEAAVVGHQAVADASTLHSRRMVEELRTLYRAALRHAAIPEVAELRHVLAAALGGADTIEA